MSQVSIGEVNEGNGTTGGNLAWQVAEQVDEGYAEPAQGPHSTRQLDNDHLEHTQELG